MFGACKGLSEPLPLISLDNVSFGYDGRPMLQDVSIELSAGSFHFLTGPSGAGKTTLMKLLYLENRPRTGSLKLFSEETEGKPAEWIARTRRRIGIIFQDFRLLDHLSVVDNIALPLLAAGKNPASQGTDLADLLRWVGLEQRAQAMPPQLSAGEKQRAAIARAVMNSPDLILADEPTGNIDPEMGGRILRMLVELNRLGKTVLVATHDIGLMRAAQGQADAKVLRLVDGRLQQGGASL